MCALRRVAAVAALCAIGFTIGGCQTIDGAPPRLYSVSEEVAAARDVALPSIVDRYNLATSDLDRMAARNEYIMRRMYIIDVEYTDFENALTRERQEFGLATAVTAQGLSTAGAVFTPATTVRVLSALASGVNATRGFYDSELLVSKTIQIIEGQMQAQRDAVATRIVTRINNNESAVTYPLSAALHDLEDYYRAGTVSEGLIKAVTDAGVAAQNAAATKEAVMLQGGAFDPTDPTYTKLMAYLTSGDRPTRAKVAQACLAKTLPGPGGRQLRINVVLHGVNNKGARQAVISCLRAEGESI